MPDNLKMLSGQRAFEQEHCSREQAVLFSREDEHYVYMSMEFYAEPIPSDDSVELNQKHRAAIADCLTPIAQGNTLYDFKL